MSNLRVKSLSLIGFLLAISLSTFTALAQDNAVADAEVTQADDDDDVEEVVVTGSRLRKTSFTSIAPLQVISTEASREVGLIDPADILQESTASAGQQIDLTFQGFVLDNGPGASTASLRGLGASRTLILVNGRRLAPAGVEGAPSSPDLNLIPAALVQRYEFLLDGASSVYGSDAVAGVVNVIMKKDFDGLELEVLSTTPEQSNGQSTIVSATYGKNYDRGFFGMGIEYEKDEEVTYADRRWLDECSKYIEIDQAGVIRDVDRYYSEVLGYDNSGECRITGSASRIIVGNVGSIWYAPNGSGNILDDWDEDTSFGIRYDADGDGLSDYNPQNHIINGNDLFTTLYPENERLSFMGYGEYTLEGNMNLTPFVEVMYNKRDTFADSGAFQLFPFISADNPFNPCNPNGSGVDCGLAEDALYTNPNIEQQFIERYGNTPTAFGLLNGPLGPQEARIVASVRGDRTQVTSELEQTRFVTGLRGDLPQIGLGGNNDWKFELSVSQTQSDGNASRPGIRQDKIDLASTTIEDSTSPSGFRCDADGDGVRESTEGCFPVNFFAASLYDGVVGDFATQAERDFLFDTRDFRTKYKQTTGSIFFDGSLFELQGGTAQAGIGYQYRDDDIESIPDEIARDGLFFGFFADGGAVGNKYTQEIFAELDLPLLGNKPAAKELNLNLSANNTKDELYGSNNTYSGKLGWRPIDDLLLRGTVGTSYRAPNLRENFLRDQTGFLTVSDPCVTPSVALVGDPFDPSVPDVYDPSLDPRSPEVLANCLIQGVDPTTFVNGGIGAYSTEIARGGAASLVAETSDSMSLGFAYDFGFIDAFDLNLGMTYYKISIDDAIIEPSSGFLVGSCYFDAGLNSPFCSRLPRDPVTQRFSLIDGSFLNRDNEKAEGLDVNLGFDKTLTINDRAVDFSADLNMNRTIHRSLTEVGINADGVEEIETTDFAGSWGFPDWQGNLQLRGEWNDYSVTWGTRYIGAVDILEEDRPDYSDIYGDWYTCGGPTVDDLLCKPVTEASSYVIHSLSGYYRGDVWTFGVGVNNLFDKAPPRIDGFGVTTANNTPLGYGYDLNGRRYFVNIGRKFDF